MPPANRRNFPWGCAGAWKWVLLGNLPRAAAASSPSEAFFAEQIERRAELGRLLGDLPPADLRIGG